MLQDDNRRPGALLHIATHDLGIQAELQKVIQERKVPADRYEFAMLFGIQTGRQQELGRQGVRCAASSATASTGSPGTCAAWANAPRTSGSWSRTCSDKVVSHEDVKG